MVAGALLLAVPACCIAGDGPSPVDAAPGFLVLPDKDEPHPAVLIAHGRQDLSSDLKDFAQSLADAGFVALLLPPITSRPDDLTAVELGFAYLRNRADVTGQAMVGFCGGGYQALLWAARSPPRLKAIVAFYGPLVFPERFQPESGEPFTSALEAAGNIDVPVQGHYGADDHIIPIPDVAALRRKLGARGGSSEIFVYDGAGHGFMDREHGNYHAESAQVAERRAIDFLRQHLGR